MEDLEFIKKFSKITISKICKELKISSSNLYSEKVSQEKVKLIRKRIESKIAELYIEK